MARLGRVEYPEVTLADGLEVVRRLERVLGATAARSALARLLGLDPRGGWFAAVIASLRLWGLTEGRGALRLTQLGQRLAEPLSSDEDLELRRQAIAHLVASAHLGPVVLRGLPGRSELAVLLEEASGADRQTVARHLTKIERILREALGSVQSDGGGVGGSGPSASAGSGRIHPPADGKPAVVELIFSGGRLSLLETGENLEVAIGLLRRRLEHLEGRNENGRAGLAP